MGENTNQNTTGTKAVQNRRRAVTPLDEARIAMIRASIRGGYISLNEGRYAQFAERGLTKSDVDRAVNIMAERGEIEFGLGGFGVTVHPAEDEK
jgi:hypothetical protein